MSAEPKDRPQDPVAALQEQQDAAAELKPETVGALKQLRGNRSKYVVAYAAFSSPTYHEQVKSALVAGYSPHSAAAQASQIMKRRDVQLAIMLVERDTRKAIAKLELVDKAWLHRHLTMLAETSILDFGVVDGQGRYKLDFRKLAERPEVAKRIDSIKVTTKTPPEGSPFIEETTVEVKLMPHAKILELVGKHADVGAWIERFEELPEGTTAARLKAARERVAGGRHLTAVDEDEEVAQAG